MLACQVLDKHKWGWNKVRQINQNELIMAIGMVCGAVLVDNFEMVSKATQSLLIKNGVENAILFLMCLKEMRDEQPQIAHFLDKHKQEFNALTKVVLNELEKELRLESEENEWYEIYWKSKRKKLVVAIKDIVNENEYLRRENRELKDRLNSRAVNIFIDEDEHLLFIENGFHLRMKKNSYGKMREYFSNKNLIKTFYQDGNPVVQIMLPRKKIYELIEKNIIEG